MTRKVIQSLDGWRNMGAKLNFERPLEVVVKPFKPRRTLDQNAKMHVMIRELAQHLGYSDTELKDYLKSEYGPSRTVQIGDKQAVIPVSTTEYNRAQAGEMIEILYMLGAECGHDFQDPENAATSNAGGSG